MVHVLQGDTVCLSWSAASGLSQTHAAGACVGCGRPRSNCGYEKEKYAHIAMAHHSAKCGRLHIPYVRKRFVESMDKQCRST